MVDGMVGATRRALAAVAALAAFGLGVSAQAQQVVKIGAVYPLSGNSASTGNYAKMAFEMGADIINNGNPELAKVMPLAKGGGLPGLKGAKIQMVIADNQGTPAAGQNQTLRLITEEKVAAVICCYQSGITLTASAVAERYGIPFLNAESVAANLTERGFKWFFRTTPVAADFAKANLPVTQKIAYSANSTDVQPQVLQLKEKNPDVVIFISYTSDAILYAKTMKELNWKPAILIADDGGFNDPAFVKAMGSVTEGLISRSVFASGKPGSVAAILDDLYKKKTGGDGLDDVSARVLQAFFVMAEAINNAGSTDPAKIRDALRAVELKPEQLVAGYDGVKFDDKGQNVQASTLITQMRNGNYVSVWPKARATHELVLPYKGW